MGSWRDDASRQAQDDLDRLFGEGMNLAQHLLGRDGEFYPAGVGIALDGSSAVIAPPVDGEPEPPAVAAALRALFRETRAGYRALALVTDVHLAELGTDAVQVLVEHSEGLAIRLTVPYSRQSGVLVYAAPIGSPATIATWA